MRREPVAMFCIGGYLTQLEAIGAMPESALLSPATAQPAPSSRDWGRLAALMLGYAGVYLCRKNFAVAIPLIGQSLSLSKAQIGAVASCEYGHLHGRQVHLRPDHRPSRRADGVPGATLVAVAAFGALGGTARVAGRAHALL